VITITGVGRNSPYVYRVPFQVVSKVAFAEATDEKPPNRHYAEGGRESSRSLARLRFGGLFRLDRMVATGYTDFMKLLGKSQFGAGRLIGRITDPVIMHDRALSVSFDRLSREFADVKSNFIRT
jgi:hypothetical protein